MATISFLGVEILPCMLMPLIFGGIIVAAIVIGMQTNKKRKETWKQVARHFHLSFVPGSGFSAGYIKGKLNGIKINVDIYVTGSGKSRTSYTRYRAIYQNPNRLGMKLTHEGFFQSIGKFFGGQDIEVGNPRFDGQVVVKGKNPREVIKYLTSERQRSILELMDNFQDILIEDNEITVKTLGHESNVGKMIATIGSIAQHAQELTVKEEHYSSKSPDKAKSSKEPPQLKVVDDHASKLKDMDESIAAQAGTVSEAQEKLDQETRSLEEKFEKDQELLKQMEEKRNELELELAEAKLDVELEELEDRIESTEKDLSSPPEVQPAETPGEQAEVEQPSEGLTDLSVAGICNSFFQDSILSSEATEKFKTLEGKEVEWAGKLLDIQKYYSDFNFKDGSGVKASFQIFEIKSKYGMTYPVKAVVQLAESDYDTYRPQVNKASFSFSGELLKVEAMMREVYLSNGSIIKQVEPSS